MTDSGFSSAASQRSTSSIIRSGHVDSFSSFLKPDLSSIPSDNEDDSKRDGSLPKPCMQFHSNGGRLSIPNRLLYGKNHGGYSPGLSPFSNQELSPMSSLTYDFKDLNTNNTSSATPRKRLSISSLSSLDSPHPTGSTVLGCSNASRDSPVPLTDTSNVESPSENTHTDDDMFQKPDGMRRRILVKNYLGKQRHVRRTSAPMDNSNCGPTLPIGETFQHFIPIAEEGCFHETPTPTAPDATKIGNVVRSLSQEHAVEDKRLMLRRIKSMSSAKGRFRLLGVRESQESPASEKENDGTSARFLRHRTTGLNMVAGPLGFSDNFSPIGSGKTFARPQQGTLCNMMSSPLVKAFSHGKSSAFKAVSPNEAPAQTKRRALGAIESNIPRAGFSPNHPSKAAGVKRFLDESANSSAITVARKKKCSKSLNAKTAFYQEKKTKSADAILTGNRPLPTFASEASPISRRSFMYRPISAPTLVVDDEDDDYVLTHSSLCSHDSDDEELKKHASEDDVSMSLCKEDDIENMMCDNKEFAGSSTDESSSNVTPTPTALDGLISGPLLLGSLQTTLVAKRDVNEFAAALVCGKSNTDIDMFRPRPRELFRSPSAPPLIPSRRAITRLKRGVRNTAQSSTETTPVSIKRPRTYASLSDAIATQPKEVPDPGLNRSRSHNELDIMKAVEQGCKNPTAVGDFSRACTLPTVAGRKQDLKYIMPKTLVEALNSGHNVGMVDVVDCRYTYEYEGGHVGGAVNVWTEEQLIERYFNCAKPMWARAKQQQALAGENKPHILVFHCEFSSERGPKLARFLRNYDRSQNVYPKLYYPEIYILKDGYREFFKVMREHCEPRSYVPMSHEAFASELRMFRIKSKTWAGEKSKHGLFNRLKNR